MGKFFSSSVSGAPPAGDRANAVINGTLSAIGVTPVFSFAGYFNLVMWGSVATTVTTTAGSATATVGSGTGIAVGQSISSANIPAGSVVAAISGTTLTIGLPAGSTLANITAGTGTAITFSPVAVSGTVRLERSFDGGVTWIPDTIQGGTTAMSFVDFSAVSQRILEPEQGVFYRLNCVAYTSGTINYRISETGSRATSFGP